jgi:hypothetical protein
MNNLLFSDVYDGDRLVIPSVTKNNVIQGQASWAKMMPPGGKLSAVACNLTKKVNNALELTYLSTTIRCK